jgi:hypothetical protein
MYKKTQQLSCVFQLSLHLIIIEIQHLHQILQSFFCPHFPA